MPRWRGARANIFVAGLAGRTLCRSRSRDRPRPCAPGFAPSASGPSAFDHAGDLVAERERQRAALAHVELLAVAEREIAVLHVQVGMADAAALDAHQHLAALAARGNRRRSRTAARRRRSAIGGAFVMGRTSTRGFSPAQRKYRASATKPSTGISSARAVGSMPAAASSAQRHRRRAISGFAAASCGAGRTPPRSPVCKRPRVAGQRLGARNQPHHRGCHLGRRHEGRRLRRRTGSSLRVRQPASTDSRP